MLLQVPRHRFLVEGVDADREVVYQGGRTFVVERHARFGQPKPYDFVRLILTHDR